MKFPSDMEIVEEASLKRVAHVIGKSSAAQAALNNADELRARGANPCFGYSRKHHCYVVFDAGEI